MKLTEKQMKSIYGGSISGTMINSLVRGINALLDLGRSLGTAIRRISRNNICPM